MTCQKYLLAGASVLILQTSTAVADEAADQMVQDALPLMHHTCKTVVEFADGDDAVIIDVVSKMTALALINRRIDLTEYTETDEDRAKIREDFIEALRSGCEDDRDALLGGVVDSAVKTTLGL